MREWATTLAADPHVLGQTTISSATDANAYRRDRRTWAAYLLLGLFAYLETSLGPAMPFIRAQLGLGYAEASLNFSAFAVGAVGVGLTGEMWLRRLGRDQALWGGIAGMIVGVLLVAFSPGLAGTIVGAFAMGSFGTVSLIANQAVLSDLHGEQRTIALTESNVAATATAVMAPLVIGGFAAAGFAWQAGVVLTVPWVLLLWWTFRDVRFPRVLPGARHRDGGQHLPVAFWVLCLVLFLVSAVEWCIAYWGADFLASVAGFPRATAATAMTLFFVAMAGGRIIGSRLARRYRGVNLLAVAIVIALVGFLLYWLAPVPALSLMGLFVTGFGIANLYPLTVAVATGAAPDLVDRATARLAVAAGTALLTAPLVVGAVSDAAGMRWGFGIVVPVLVLAFAGSLIAARLLPAVAESLPLAAMPAAE